MLSLYGKGCTGTLENGSSTQNELEKLKGRSGARQSQSHDSALVRVGNGGPGSGFGGRGGTIAVCPNVTKLRKKRAGESFTMDKK